MQIELVKYAQETDPHGFEAQVSISDIEKAENTRVGGRVHVGRVKVFDEETGKYTWFVIEAMRNGKKQPILEIVNIRDKKDYIVKLSGKMRKPQEVGI